MPTFALRHEGHQGTLQGTRPAPGLLHLVQQLSQLVQQEGRQGLELRDSPPFNARSAASGLLRQRGLKIRCSEVREVHRHPDDVAPEPLRERLPGRLGAVAVQGEDRAPRLPEEVVHLREVGGEGLVPPLEHGSRHAGLALGVAIKASGCSVPAALNPGRPGAAALSAGLLGERRAKGAESREGARSGSSSSRFSLEERRHPRVRGVQQRSRRRADVRPKLVQLVGHHEGPVRRKRAQVLLHPTRELQQAELLLPKSTRLTIALRSNGSTSSWRMVASTSPVAGRRVVEQILAAGLQVTLRRRAEQRPHLLDPVRSVHACRPGGGARCPAGCGEGVSVLHQQSDRPVVNRIRQRTYHAKKLGGVRL